MTVVLSLDAMGGDRAPQIVIEGAALALGDDPSLRFLLFGNSSILSPLLEQRKNRDPNISHAFEIVHTDQVISNDAKGASAIRGPRFSSLRLAVEAVEKQEAQAVVSAGNTGAYMALSKIVLGTLPGIDRPAIAGLVPTFRGLSAMLDLGANAECDFDNLVQFAILGDSFARLILNVPHPSIGLLNMGSEESKGNALLQKTAQRLRELQSSLNFHGFIEGDDITAGTTDVVVTDGFSGNIAVKSIEGTAKLMSSLLKKGVDASWKTKIGAWIARSAFEGVAKKIDPRLFNGAAFLGLKKIAIKSHGGTDSLGFASAIRVAAGLVRRDFIGCLTRSLEQASAIPMSEKVAEC